MIDLHKDITLVVGIDRNTIEQLKISWPTWHKHRPLMWDWPWIVFYDPSHLKRAQVADLVGEMHRCENGRQTMLVEWPMTDAAYESQREKMLTGHMFVPATYVKTAWHMKLDTDALAMPHDAWIKPEWFEPSDELHRNLEHPVYVAPRWGYTKGVGFLAALDDWGDRIMPGSARLNIPQERPDQKRVGHSRMCSWCSYYRTSFTRDIAARCVHSTAGLLKLPVPSQDTVAWYVAERLKLFRRIVHMKAHGWNNYPSTENLRRVAAEIMGNGQKSQTA